DEWQQCNPGIGEMLRGKWLRFVEQIRAITFRGGRGPAAAPLQIANSGAEDENGADAAEPRCGVRCGPKRLNGNHVLDLRCARERIHSEGKCAERDRRGNQAFWQPSLTEDFGGERIDCENDYE